MGTKQTLERQLTGSGAPVVTSRSRRPRGFGYWFRDTGWRHLVAIGLAIFALFPLLYVVSASLQPNGTLVGSNDLFSTFDLANYRNLFNNPSVPFPRWFVNSLIVGTATALLTVLFGALAAYSFSRMRFRGRRTGLLSLMLIQMFPQFIAFVAIFLLLSSITDVFPAIGLGTLTGLTMVYLGGALGVNTYLMYGFFNTVPKSIDEAAKIDGAGHARIFFTITIRLVTPVLAVVGLLSFIAVTSEYVIASVALTDPDSQTLAVGLYRLVSQQFSNYWSVFAAGAVLAALPVVAAFLLMQRYIVSGLIAGSVK